MKYRIILLAILAFVACKPDKESKTFPDEMQSLAWSQQLESDLLAFQKSSQNTLELTNTQGFSITENSEILKQNFGKLMADFAKIEYLNVASIRNNFLFSGVAGKPVDEQIIEDVLKDTSFVFNTENIEKLSSRAKGLYVIEYLLFTPNLEPTIKVIDYLQALLALNKAKADELVKTWQQSISTTSEDISLSFSGFRPQILNAQLALLEDLSNNKLGLPLGLFDGGVVQVEKAHLFLSKTSLQSIKSSLASFKSYNTTGAFSTAEWVKAISDNGTEIATRLIEKCNKVDAILEDIGSDNLENILNQHPEKVLELYNASKALLAEYKVFVIPTLGVTVTFTDNDGD